MMFRSSLLTIFALLTLHLADSMAPSSSRLMNLQTQAPEGFVAFVLGDNGEPVPASVGGMSNGRRELQGRFLQASEPTASDQYMLERVNAARANPQMEADAHLNGDLNSGLPGNTITATPKPPLAYNLNLWAAAKDHSQWMLDNDVFSHTGEGGSSPTQRMETAGYTFIPPWSTGENIAYSGTTGTPNLVSLTGRNHVNLFQSPGHRRNLMNQQFREVGISNLQGQFNTYNSVMTTQKFAYVGSRGPFITGVAYTDATNDDAYTVGEGLGGISVSAVDTSNSANTFTTTTMAAGGYQLDVNANTAYRVTFSGDLLNDGSSVTAVYEVNVGSDNVKIDCVSDQLSIDPPVVDSTMSPTSEPSFATTSSTSNSPTFHPTAEPTTTAAGTWGEWGGWSSCSTTCGSGTQTQTRTCVGEGCIGISTNTQTCNEGTCPAVSYFTMTGDCDMQDNCVSSGNYPALHDDHEDCTITMLKDAGVTVGTTFELERCCDHLMINGVDVETSTAVPKFLGKGTTFTWTSDYSVTKPGWQLCFSEPPTFTSCDWVAVSAEDCPRTWRSLRSMQDCHQDMVVGELCEADKPLPNGSQSFDINNCGPFDVFRYSCT